MSPKDLNKYQLGMYGPDLFQDSLANFKDLYNPKDTKRQTNINSLFRSWVKASGRWAKRLSKPPPLTLLAYAAFLQTNWGYSFDT